VHSFLLFLSACFIHELGHVSMALVLGVKCHRIGWRIWGMTTEMDLPENYAEYVFVTLAGPVTTIAFFLLACMEGWFGFALANACILVACYLPSGDFWRLTQYRELKKKMLVRKRLEAVCG
jgi:hypothetical protein